MTASDPKASIRELMGPVVNRPPLVKVCGIMNIHSALVAVESGADFLGFIFVKGSRREVPVSEARYIVDTLKKIYGESQPIDENIVVKRPLTNSSWFSASCDQIRSRLERDDRPLYVGVFQDQSADYINEIVEQVGLDLVQLHGDEPFSMCSHISVPAIKVLHVSNTVTADEILNMIQPGQAAGVALDTIVGNTKGGTGQVFDWNVAAEIARNQVPIMLAGGLNDENVEECIRTCYPWAVDVSGGVETDLVKDPHKIRRFIWNVKGTLKII
jgi:anthranilate synthase/indole-3-glycerol phosphate synthase/phosphoribosylanthranilate isomerase